MTSTEASPLLAPFTPAQQVVFDVIAAVWLEHGRFPSYAYVERMTDRQDEVLEAILPTFPAIRAGGVPGAIVPTYRAVYYDSIGISAPDRPVGLTVAGLAHLPHEKQPIVRTFLKALSTMARHRNEVKVDPWDLQEPEVDAATLAELLGSGFNTLVPRLPVVLEREPATMGGVRTPDSNQPGQFFWRSTRALRYFLEVGTVEEYLDRIAIFYAPSSASESPGWDSAPLELAACLDFLDTVWQLKYGHRLLVSPSVTVVTGQSIEASSIESFEARLSDLGQVLKGLDVPPAPNVQRHPVQWLGAKLIADLGEPARARAEAAVELLEAAVFVRNAGAHSQAAARSIAALSKFGVAYPITDWGLAWQMIRAAVASAVWTLREELQASLV